MATLQQVRDKANARFADFWSVLTLKQNLYFAKHGRYFGFKWSPVTIQLDGEDTALVINRPLNLVKHVAADVDFSGEAPVPFSIMVIRRHGQTHGYEAFIRINHEGTIYQRSRTSENIDSGWGVVTPSSLY